jgi:hypothetical protein
LGLEPLEDRCLMTAGLQVTPFDNESPLSVLTDSLLAAHSGITITEATFLGTDGQAGTYTGFDLHDAASFLKLLDGILLTSGRAVNALGPNDTSGVTAYTGTPGDPRLDLLAGARTFDGNSLTIQFQVDPGVQSILFDFVFGSEEFPEYVGAFNDAFAAFLDGNQISFDGQGKPVTVNNNFFQLNNAGADFEGEFPFASVTDGKTRVDYDIQYDGLTPALTTQAQLDRTKSIHTLTFIIADAGDPYLDSGVFLAQLRGSTFAVGEAHTDIAGKAPAPTPVTVAPPAPTPLLVPATDSTLGGILTKAEEEHKRTSAVFPILLASLQEAPSGKLFFPTPEAPKRAGSPGAFALTLSSGQEVSLGSISGRVFEDYDGNGLQATNEPGLAGQVVYLDNNGNGYFDDNEPWTLTNEKGEYRFQGLAPGVYKVRQVIWSHLEPTQPTSGERLVTLSRERNAVGDQDFGAVQRTVAARPAAVDISRETEVELVARPKIKDEPATLKDAPTPGETGTTKDGTLPKTAPERKLPAITVDPNRKDAKKEDATPSNAEQASVIGSGVWMLAASSGLAALWFSAPRGGEKAANNRLGTCKTKAVA